MRRRGPLKTLIKKGEKEGHNPGIRKKDLDSDEQDGAGGRKMGDGKLKLGGKKRDGRRMEWPLDRQHW